MESAKAVFVLGFCVLLIVAVSAATVAMPSKPATLPVKKFNLDTKSLAKTLEQQPGWLSLCPRSKNLKQFCEELKTITKDIVCSIGVASSGPLGKLLGNIDPTSIVELTAFRNKCRAIVTGVVFDCNAFQQGKTSCGKLKGCENGKGFYLQMNPAKARQLTGYQVPEYTFIPSGYFKNQINRKECQTGS